MNIKSVGYAVNDVISKSAMFIAKKTVESDEKKPPLCTIIIHQPDVPEKLKNMKSGVKEMG